ncbi:MAG: hypothetical protein JSS76_12345 [Bacteroidetes bacterium]|nr:hypothetical protein [Bacteroidota bacterium]
MKSLFLLLIIVGISAAATAQTHLKVYNDDSTNHTYTVTACGKTSTITLHHNRTGPVTIKGCSNAVISTPTGPLNVKNGDKVYIKDGKPEVVSRLWLKHIDYK